MKQSRGLLIGIGAALVIVAGLFVASRQASAPQTEDTSLTQTDSIGDENFSILVPTQKPGTSLIYNPLNAIEPVLVVVRDEGGAVVGSSYVEAGSDLIGEVPVPEGTVNGSEYIVELYQDVNDNQLFDAADTVLVTENGSEIRTRVKIDENLEDFKG